MVVRWQASRVGVNLCLRGMSRLPRGGMYEDPLQSLPWIAERDAYALAIAHLLEQEKSVGTTAGAPRGACSRYCGCCPVCRAMV